jgi:GT2 family glycosyltransferase
VVDNASFDGTASILKRYADRIRILKESKRGPAAARNRGILAAHANVIAQTDADCVAGSAWLRELVDRLQSSGALLVGGTILSRRPCNELELFGEQIHDHEKAITVYKPPYVITMNCIARGELFERIGLFDEEMLRCEDVDLAWRAVQAGLLPALAPAAVVHHRNERTWSGLFHEGFLHGLFAVQAMRKHSAFLASVGHRRFDARSYIAIARALGDGVAGRRDRLCEAVFSGAKKLGKLAGSLRFGYFDA